MRIYVISKEVSSTTIEVASYAELLKTLGFPEAAQRAGLSTQAIYYAFNTSMYKYYDVLDFLEPEESNRYRYIILFVEALEFYLRSLHKYQNSPKVAESIRTYEYLIKLAKKGYTVFRY